MCGGGSSRRFRGTWLSERLWFVGLESWKWERTVSRAGGVGFGKGRSTLMSVERQIVLVQPACY
jgi:hypothetical protein